ncbi:hypothetical protein WMY93_027585 [Mugilogobius chulae]|uniref:DUF4743 domain-containing protein n=1 Tax=Mugilogobius chulae TaxID=88201 RepID=A0AAW0MZ65_9GOBI
MTSSAWAERVLHLLRRMNNFWSAGSSRSRCFPFEVDGVRVGWVPPHVASQLSPYPQVFSVTPGGAVSLCPTLNSYTARSEAVDAVLQSLRKQGCFKCLTGWRDEKYSVMDRFSDPPLMWMERAATSLFGVKRYGVHINAYTVSPSGELSMWLARRSATKQTYPGLLDNMKVVVTVVLSTGGWRFSCWCSVKHTAVKECAEEACVPEELALKARPVNTVR